MIDRYICALTNDSLQRESASDVRGATVSQCRDILREQNVGAWHACICAAIMGVYPIRRLKGLR
jgi:hypothetical protein